MTVTVNPNDTAAIADYCRRDETITEDGWCNRCGDYVDLESVDNDLPTDPWRCEQCGSTAMQQRAWVEIDSGKIVSFDDCERSDYFCPECDTNRYPVRQSELLQKACKWWVETDFKAMERLTCYRQPDYDPADGYQTFVDTCNGWWDGKTTEEKISIYLQNC